MRRGALSLSMAAAAAMLLPAPAPADVFAPLTSEGLPNVQSDAALVLDMDDGTILYGKNPDKMGQIASTGKIFVALVVRKHGLDLDATTEITEVDKKYGRGGARTRLWEGYHFKNIDLLRAMLMASDNRAPTALGRAVGLGPRELVAEMNVLARELGLTRTHFTDPSGLRGNESTPREMVVGLQKALEDEVLSEIMSTERVTVRSEDERPKVINYGNTNKALHAGRYPVHGGKTGYTEEAGYCLVVAAEIGGRNLAMAYLGAKHELTRYGDFNRVAAWVAAKKAEGEDGDAGGDGGR